MKSRMKMLRTRMTLKSKKRLRSHSLMTTKKTNTIFSGATSERISNLE